MKLYAKATDGTLADSPPFILPGRDERAFAGWLFDVADELAAIIARHRPFASRHEAAAEAVQVAAVAIRFLLEVCPRV